jgi:hypothetical protein
VTAGEESRFTAPHSQRDFGSAAQSRSARVPYDLESVGVGFGFKDPLLGARGGFGRDGDAVGDQEGRVEAESELCGTPRHRCTSVMARIWI